MKNKEKLESAFKRVASKRTEKILDGIRSLGKCSSRNYSFKSTDIDKIFSEIEKEIFLCKGLFYSKIGRSEKFKL